MSRLRQTLINIRKELDSASYLYLLQEWNNSFRSVSCFKTLRLLGVNHTYKMRRVIFFQQKNN